MAPISTLLISIEQGAVQVGETIGRLFLYLGVCSQRRLLLLHAEYALASYHIPRYLKSSG